MRRVGYGRVVLVALAASAVVAALAALPAGRARADAPPGEDFTPRALVLYRVAACGDGPLSAVFADKKHVKLIEAHCKDLHRAFDKYRRRWLERAQPFLAALRPAGIPDRVVYPFGGGDLLTALAAFPDAAEITTISLEGGGDPRRIDGLSGKALKESLKAIRVNVNHVVARAWAATTSLNNAANSDLPGQVVFALVALAIHGHAPVSLRYFELQPDGSVRYVTADDIARDDATRGKRKPKPRLMVQPDLWNHFEIRYRRAGDPSAPVRVYRHIAYDLSDGYLRDDPALLRHLEAKGRVAAMTKAAVYHLWTSEFSMIRGYLLANMEWMISDSTGIPPEFAEAGGFVQETWGRFEGRYFEYGSKRHEKAFVKLWSRNPYRKLTFRFGYHDVNTNDHLLITRRAR